MKLYQKYLDLKLGNKILIPILFVLSLGIGTSFFYSYYAAQTAAYSNMQDQASQTSIVIQNIVKDWLQSRTREIATLSKADQYVAALNPGFLGRAARASSGEELKKIVEENPYYLDINLSLRDGVVISSSSKQRLEGSSHLDKSSLEQVLNGQNTVSQVQMDPHSNTPYITVSSPIFSDGNISGAIFGRVSVTRFNNKFIKPIKIGTRGFVMVINSSAQLISHPSESRILQKNEQDSPIAQIFKMQQGTLSYEEAGIDYIASFLPFKERNLVIAIVQHRQDVFALAEQQGLTNIYVGLIVGLLCAMTVIFVTRKVLIAPLSQLQHSSKELAEGHLDRSIDCHSKDELGDLASSFELMRKAIQIKVREIQEHNKTLDLKVKERTLDLFEKKNDIENMLQNLIQGIFTIMDDRTIHKEYSKFTESILESHDIAGQDPIELLFLHSNADQNTKAENESALDLCLGEQEFAFFANGHLFARELTLETSDGQKTVEIDWIPICNQDHLIEKIMVTMRDVTTERELKNQNKLHLKKINMFGEILHTHSNSFQSFLSRVKTFLVENKKLLTNSMPISIESIESCFRNMHTIKGSSKVLGLSYFAEPAHLAESRLDIVRKNKDMSSKQIEAAIQDLESLNLVVQEYENLFKELSDFTESAKQNTISTQETEAVILELNKRYGSDAGNLVRNALGLHPEASFSDIVQLIEKSFPETCRYLGKPTPSVHLTGGDIAIPAYLSEHVLDILTHVFRNNLDHGIESPDVRSQKGKKEAGDIFVDISMTSTNDIQIVISDDGQGLNINRLREKHKELVKTAENLPDQQIAELIFSSGVSTQTHTTEISGRGVGMDMVKSFTQRLGGQVNLDLGQTSQEGFAQFRLIFTFPVEIQAQLDMAG